MSCDGILFYPITDLCGFFFIIEPLFGKGIKKTYNWLDKNDIH